MLVLMFLLVIMLLLLLLLLLPLLGYCTVFHTPSSVKLVQRRAVVRQPRRGAVV